MQVIGTDELTVEWLPPTDDGGLPIQSYRAWACDVETAACYGAVSDAEVAAMTISSLPTCSNFTVSVEALNSLGSSGNVTVGGDTVMSSVVGTIFTTPGIPADGHAPFMAHPLPAFDNETTLNLMWWAPFDNGVPLEQHELIVAPPGTDASGDIICTTSAVDGVILDPACSNGPLYSSHCGVGGHSLCRECGMEIGQEPCSDGTPHALGDADAMGGGAVRIRVPHSGIATRLQQFFLFDMVKGTEYTVIVRARNALGWGAPSPPATLRTAGDPPPPPSLALDSAAALSAEDEEPPPFGLIAAGVVFLLIVCCVCVCVKKFRERFEVLKREEVENTETLEEEAVSRDRFEHMSTPGTVGRLHGRMSQLAGRLPPPLAPHPLLRSTFGTRPCCPGGGDGDGE